MACGVFGCVVFYGLSSIAGSGLMCFLVVLFKSGSINYGRFLIRAVYKGKSSRQIKRGRGTKWGETKLIKTINSKIACDTWKRSNTNNRARDKQHRNKERHRTSKNKKTDTENQKKGTGNNDGRSNETEWNKYTQT